MKYKDLLIVLNKYLENWALATFHVEPDASQWFFHKEVLMHREWHCCEEIFLGILNVKFQPSIQLRQPILKIHIYYWIPNTILNKFWKKIKTIWKIFPLSNRRQFDLTFFPQELWTKVSFSWLYNPKYFKCNYVLNLPHIIKILSFGVRFFHEPFTVLKITGEVNLFTYIINFF